MTWYTKSRRLVFEEEGTVDRCFIQRDDTCKQSRYDSAKALGYTECTCAARGYPVKHENMGMTWYTKSRRARRLDTQGTTILCLPGGAFCKESKWHSAWDLGYKECR